MGRVMDPGAWFPGYRFPAIIIGEAVCCTFGSTGGTAKISPKAAMGWVLAWAAPC